MQLNGQSDLNISAGLPPDNVDVHLWELSRVCHGGWGKVEAEIVSWLDDWF